MHLLTPKRFLLNILGFGLFLLLVVATAPFIGAEKISLREALHHLRFDAAPLQSPDVDILVFQRVPRIALGVLSGGALALVGAVFQAVLRNPLATPYTLGVSGGGALGAVVAISFSVLSVSWGPFSSVQIFALMGSLINIAIVYGLARSRGHFNTSGLLLAGVTLGLISSAMILLVRYLSDPHQLVQLDRWMMGGVDVEGFRDLSALLPFLLPGCVLLLAHARDLDQLSFGEEMAAGRGVPIARLQRIAFFGGSLVTSAVVAVTGPIGFVGLIVPHTVRRLVGPDHRLLLPCVFLAGGGFLVLCDTVARTIVAPTELPVGILTSLMGGPFFLWLLVRGRFGEGGR